MKRIPPTIGPQQSPELSPAEKAEYYCKVLLETSKALKGAADLMDKGGEEPLYLLTDAGWTLANAIACDLIATQDLGLADAPYANPVIEKIRARARARSAEIQGGVYLLKESKAQRPRKFDPESLDPSFKKQTVKIKCLVRDIDRNGDSGGREGEELDRGVFQVLWTAYETLSNTHPELLSPEVALIKNQLLPGIDPWLGGARDFRKVAWVCETTAKLIEQRCDLRMIDAATESGIDEGLISRACSKGHIKTNGKKRTQLRMNRPSFASWAIKHREFVAKREKQIKASRPPKRQYMCDSCFKIVDTDKKPCPHCHTSHIKELKSHFSPR